MGMGISIGIGIGLGGGNAFTPAGLAGLFAVMDVALARSSGKLWQDAGKTVAAVAASDPVRVAVCPYTAVEFTAPSDAARPTLGNSGALWWLQFDAVDDYLAFSGPASIPLSIHLAFRWEGAAGGVGAGISAPANGQKLKTYDGSVTSYRGGKEAVSNWSTAGTVLAANTNYVGGINYAATGDARYVYNGADDGLAQATVEGTGLSANLSRVGASSSGTELWNGRIYGWAIYSQAQTGADLLLLHRYLGALAGLSI
jgi:hypothetical protein